MDAGFLNFHKEEDFSSYFLDRCTDDSHSFDDTNSNSATTNVYNWDWDNDETELNGDVGLIPISSHVDVDFCPISNSPPSRDDFNKIMTEWQQLISLDNNEDLAVDIEITSTHKSDDDLSIENVSTNFDIANYMEEKEEEVPVPQMLHVEIKPRLGGKRIDMAARRYVIDTTLTSEDDSSDDEEVVDVETIAETSPQPVLQAGDLDSLLAQFEATECTNMEISQCMKTGGDIEIDAVIDMELTPTKDKKMIIVSDNINYTDVTSPILDVTSIKAEKMELLTPTNNYIKMELVTPPIKSPVKNHLDYTIKSEQRSPKRNITSECSPKMIEEKAVVVEPILRTPTKDHTKNKQILDSLPPELIERIRQSCKRKPPVPLIAPILPTRKRSIPPASIINVTPVKINRNLHHHLDHDYCSNAPRSKDSGFSSCDEDERSVLRNQPTVKNADGKLMVSLLKTNTIKKKLNLEEYKKRIQVRSQGNSGRNSPAPEEYNMKKQEQLIEQQQLLIGELLKSITSLQKQDEFMKIILPQHEIILEQQKGLCVNVADVQKIQAKLVSIQQQVTTLLQSNQIDLKIKTLISLQKLIIDEQKMAMRTPQNPSIPIKSEPLDHNDVKPKMVMKTLVSVGTNTEESWGHLEQILQNTELKISPNSLISSMVELIPNIKPEICGVEHGEDKTIVYLDMERVQPELKSVLVQTIRSTTHRRRRRSSGSSNSSGSSRDSSRSRTPSPVRRRHTEQIREVEERRVIYVGRISDDATREDLRRRFSKYGQITNVSVHFRRRADNYGFVTFMHKEDAYHAVEKGNDDPDEPQYDLSFGGRRLFCQTTYADLDNVKDDECFWSPITGAVYTHQGNSFDALLRQAQAKLKHRQV